MWARFHARTPGPVSGQLYEMIGGGTDQPLFAFLSPFGCRPWLCGHPRPPGSWAFVTSGLPPNPEGMADPDGVSVFRTHETRLGLGAPCTPGTAVSTRPRTILGRRLPPSNGRSLSSRHHKPPQDGQLTRHQRGFTGIHPMPSLPLACGPRTERGPLGFPASFAPDRRWRQQPRTSRWGQVLDTDPNYVVNIG
jgi:hypothetical protein